MRTIFFLCFLILAFQPAILHAANQATPPEDMLKTLLDPEPETLPAQDAQRSSTSLKAAELDLSNGDSKSAEKNLQDSILYDSTNTRAFLLFGDQLKREGDTDVGEAKEKAYTRAMLSYMIAARLDPKNPGTFFSVGELFRYRDDYDNAAGAYKEVLALAPDYPDAKNRLAEVERSEAYYKKMHTQGKKGGWAVVGGNTLASPKARKEDSEVTDTPSACDKLLEAIPSQTVAKDGRQPSFTTRFMLAQANRMDGPVSRLSKMKKQKPHCTEAATGWSCYQAFLSKNPPASSVEVSLYLAGGIALLGADKKAGVLSKADYGYTIAELPILTLENFSPPRFLSSSLEAKGPVEAKEKEFAECTEREMYVKDKNQIMKKVTKVLNVLEKKYSQSASPEEKKRVSDMRARLNALQGSTK